MKLWIDDVRPAPAGYTWCHSVNETKYFISAVEETRDFMLSLGLNIDSNDYFELIDIDHDAGDYALDGGDYIKLLDWLEETGRSYPIHIHSMNPVGVQNMRAIIQHNGWKEV